MIKHIQRSSVLRHWPLMVAVAAWMLLLPAFFQSEIIRAVVAVACIALMAFQLLTYRKVTRGADFVFLSLVLGGFGLANLWLALNVVRFYTYAPERDRWALHISVVRVQTALAWAIGIVVSVVCVWALLRIARWVVTRMPCERQSGSRLGVLSLVVSAAPWVYDRLPYGILDTRYFRILFGPVAILAATALAGGAAFRGSKWWLLALVGPVAGLMLLFTASA